MPLKCEPRDLARARVLRRKWYSALVGSKLLQEHLLLRAVEVEMIQFRYPQLVRVLEGIEAQILQFLGPGILIHLYFVVGLLGFGF
jgi:hypothetical protein